MSKSQTIISFEQKDKTCPYRRQAVSTVLTGHRTQLDARTMPDGSHGTAQLQVTRHAYRVRHAGGGRRGGGDTREAEAQAK